MNTTRDFFDARAGIWDEITQYGCSADDFRRLVSMAGVGRGKNVVDIGCGTGVLTPYLAEAVENEGEIFAVDISPEMLKVLAKKHAHSNVRPMATSAEDMSRIPAATADASICFCAFPHFEDKDAAVSEMARVTKPGGKLLISHLESREDLNKFHKSLEEPVCRHDLPDCSEMFKLLTKHGFKVLHYIDTKGRYELLAQRQ